MRRVVQQRREDNDRYRKGQEFEDRDGKVVPSVGIEILPVYTM